METINIASLKSTLSSVLRRVREGEVFRVLDRHTAIATIIAYKDETLSITKRAEGKIVAPKCVQVRNLSDPIKILREDRDRR